MLPTMKMEKTPELVRTSGILKSRINNFASREETVAHNVLENCNVQSSLRFSARKLENYIQSLIFSCHEETLTSRVYCVVIVTVYTK